MRPCSSRRTDVDWPTPERSRSVRASSADPLAYGLAVQVHGQVGVDEQVLAEVQRAADAVAEVGERRRRAAAASAPPPRPSASAGETSRAPGRGPSRRGRSAARSPSGESPAVSPPPVPARRPAVFGAGDVGSARGAPLAGSATSPRRSSVALARRTSVPSSVVSRASASASLRPGRVSRALTEHRLQRHRARELDGEPHAAHRRRRLERLDRAGQQRGRRAAVQRRRRPTGRGRGSTGRTPRRRG